MGRAAVLGNFGPRGYLCDFTGQDAAGLKLGACLKLGGSGEAETVTGTTAITPLASVVIPGGMMGPNGILRLYTLWSMTGSANAKTLRAMFGGYDIMSAQSITAAGTVSTNKLRVMHNRNSETAQICYSGWGELGGNTSPAVAGAIDTRQDVVFTISGQLASAAEFLTLEAWMLEVMPGP